MVLCPETVKCALRTQGPRHGVIVVPFAAFHEYKSAFFTCADLEKDQWQSAFFADLQGHVKNLFFLKGLPDSILSGYSFSLGFAGWRARWMETKAPRVRESSEIGPVLFGVRRTR
jgi:hypothetical protein